MPSVFKLGRGADSLPEASRSARSCSSINARSVPICERAGRRKSEQNDASACTLARNSGGKNKTAEGRGRGLGNTIPETETRQNNKQCYCGEKLPVLGRADKTGDVVKTNKTSEVAESTFNPGAKQLLSLVSLRLYGLCSPSQTDVRRGRRSQQTRSLVSGKWREFNSPTHQPADFRELVLQSSSLGNDDHQSTHKLSKSLKVYNSQ